MNRNADPSRSSGNTTAKRAAKLLAPFAPLLLAAACSKAPQQSESKFLKATRYYAEGGPEADEHFRTPGSAISLNDLDRAIVAANKTARYEPSEADAASQAVSEGAAEAARYWSQGATDDWNPNIRDWHTDFEDLETAEQFAQTAEAAGYSGSEARAEIMDGAAKGAQHFEEFARSNRSPGSSLVTPEEQAVLEKYSNFAADQIRPVKSDD